MEKEAVSNQSYLIYQLKLLKDHLQDKIEMLDQIIKKQEQIMGKEDKPKFQLGDRVFDPRWGWGEVCEIIHGHRIPIKVRFSEETSHYYSLCGYASEYHEYPLLWTEEEAKERGYE